ncbi:MAG TPA: hypothetical protein VFK52_08630 [Nocardioidaceae bacterium]|nr:hypothetical protein [Nocardioidaceae bacterium]
MTTATHHPLTRPDSRFQTLLPAPVAYTVGVVGAIGTVLLGLPDELGLVLGCIGVAGLYSVYPVFSLLWGDSRERATEVGYLLLGVLVIALAVAVDPRWLALGWLLHGCWDLLHHRDHHKVGLRGIPLWYVQACLAWDFPAAVGLFLVL